MLFKYGLHQKSHIPGLLLSQPPLDFFFFFLSLWIYLWLAETSQQPINQTTWLKVTPHCNHCFWYADAQTHFKRVIAL